MNGVDVEVMRERVAFQALHRAFTTLPATEVVSLLDEIEDLRARLAAIEAELVLTYAEREYVYECARLRIKPRWDELDEDVRDEWLEDARIQVGALIKTPDPVS